MEKIYVANNIVDDDNVSHGYLVYEADLNEMKENAKHNCATYGKLLGHFRSLRDFLPVILAGSIIVNTTYTLDDLKLEIQPHEFKEK